MHISLRLCVLLVLLFLSALASYLQPCFGEEKICVRVSVEKVDVRRGPGVNYPVLTAAPKDALLEILGTDKDWYSVQLPDGRKGWVNRKHTTGVAVHDSRNFNNPKPLSFRKLDLNRHHLGSIFSLILTTIVALFLFMLFSMPSSGILYIVLRHKYSSFRMSILKFYTLFAAISIAVAVGGAVWIWNSVPDLELFKKVKRHTRVTVIKMGDIIEVESSINHLPISLEEMPPFLPKAVIAVEDRRFLDHFGIDPVGFSRAFYRNIFDGKTEGASTITQQVAKNMFLSPEKSLVRKIKELILSLKIEKHNSKKEILELYLNGIYFGGQIYGIESAARHYFHKRAASLNLYEVGVLVGSIPKPSFWNINRSRKKADTRARQVLEEMVKQGYVTHEEANDALRVGIKKGATQLRRPESRYFIDAMKSEILEKWASLEGRLTIFTTLDPEMQVHAEIAVEKTLNRAALSKEVQAAFIALDQDGAIRAMIGGVDYADSQFNRAVQAYRQPGSLFKPFIYLSALEFGSKPNDPILDAPIEVDHWRPTNFDGKYLGRITLSEALSKSRNAAAVRLMEKVKRSTVIQLARRLGIVSSLLDKPSLALGCSEVTLLEICSAYNCFSNGGYRVKSYAIQGICDRLGNVKYWHTPAAEKVIQPRHNEYMNKMLTAVISPNGTGRKAILDGRWSGGKTGTSQDNRDAWFIGYTKHLLAGIWIGKDDNSPMRNVSGGDLPALAWKEFMKNVYEHMDVVTN